MRLSGPQKEIHRLGLPLYTPMASFLKLRTQYKFYKSPLLIGRAIWQREISLSKSILSPE